MKVKYKNLVWPFGKYKGEYIKNVVQDRFYINWLLEQEWFKKNCKELYEVVTNPQEEYNRYPLRKVRPTYISKHDLCRKEGISMYKLNQLLVYHGYLKNVVISERTIAGNLYARKYALARNGYPDGMKHTSGSNQQGTFKFDYEKIKHIFEDKYNEEVSKIWIKYGIVKIKEGAD